MKSFVKKDSLFIKREVALKKNLKKEKKYKVINQTKECQYFQTNGLKKCKKRYDKTFCKQTG